MDTFLLTEAKLNLEEIFDKVKSPSCGAVSFFAGTTRDSFEDKEVLSLIYETYEDMAIKQLKQISDEMRKRWELGNIAIYHRLGEVPIGETSVIIAVSSKHRKESLEAVEYGINNLKKHVPIWKKEIYKGFEGEWKQNKECPWNKS